MRNKILAIALGAGMLTSWGAVPEGYYNPLNGKSGVALRNAVKAAVGNHTRINYGEDTWVAFEKTDTRTVGGEKCWWDMYSLNNVPVNSGHPGMNIEHSVPNSWGFKNKSSDAYCDLFNLNPSNSDANSRKSNYPMGEISGSVHWENGATFIGKPKSGMEGGQGGWCWEPLDEYKGDFARGYFYMFSVYNDVAWNSEWGAMYDTSSELLLKPWAAEMLLDWAGRDEVSDKETKRNEAVYEVQHNRNPFIDFPDLARYIWGDKKNEVFYTGGDHGTDPIDPDPVDPDPIDPDPIIPETAEWELVKSVGQLENGMQYIITATDKNVAMSTELNNTYFARGGELTSTDGIISIIGDDTAIITLEQSGSAWHLAVSNRKGENLGYIDSSKAKNVKLAESMSATTAATIEIDYAGKADVSYGSAGKLQYNNSSPRFTTYTSGQQPLSFWKKKQTTVQVESINARPVIRVEGGTISVDRPAEIYDLNGRRVSGVNRSAGIYIVVTDRTNVFKVVIN